jgi:AcrR family transcriptional regulator
MQERARTRTREDPEVRRKKILEEAVRLIGQRGYHGFTIQELAERCALTNGGLLYHFPSKDQVLLAVLQERDRRETSSVLSMAASAARKAAHDASSVRDVLELLRAIVVRGAAQPELGRLYMLLQAESTDSGHPAHRYFRKREAMVLKSFAKILSPHVPDPHSSARHIYALMDGLEQQWLRADQGFDLLAEWDRAVVMLLPKTDRRST